MLRNENYECQGIKSSPLESIPSPNIQKNITEDLQNINYALCEMERLAENMISKIDGGNSTNGNNPSKEPSCISELLEDMKKKAEKLYYRLDQINSFI